jgi:MoaA/NifB/PqqE/SkfB family radical SAM enzyme
VWGHLYVTRHCNLHCDYCFFRDPHKPDLPEADLLRVVDRMWDLGIRFLTFHGGEPTLRPDFLRIVKHAHDLGFFLYLNTNGTRLTAAYVDALGAAGVDLVNLSVDSVVDFAHSHKDLAHSTEVLHRLIAGRARHGFEITVNLVLTKKNLAVLRPTLEVMRELGIPVSIGFIVKHLWSEAQEPSRFFRTPEEQARLLTTLDELTALRRAGANLVEPAPYFQDLKRFVTGALEWECLAGRDSIGVDTLGELKFCGTLPTEPITIFDVDRLDTEQLYRMRREKYGDCHRRCVTNCRYVT